MNAVLLLMSSRTAVEPSEKDSVICIHYSGGRIMKLTQAVLVRQCQT